MKLQNFVLEKINPTNKKLQIKKLLSGYINSTYKISIKGEPPILLQKINKKIFLQPQLVQQNYKTLTRFLIQQKSSFYIPPIHFINNKIGFWDDEKQYWRATNFVLNSKAFVLPKSQKQVEAAASMMSLFTASFENLEMSKLKITLPNFHNLNLRFEQFKDAVEKNTNSRKKKARELIEILFNKKKYIFFYDSIIHNEKYKLRVMHHDAKISNILFNKIGNKCICPIDLDTVMPGYFFSDIGDMIRSMACSENENEKDDNKIFLNEKYYEALVFGYLKKIQNQFSNEEINNIHASGLLIIYMQALRFLTDYLNNDTYYGATYENQNYDRSKNQHKLLTEVEKFVHKKYGYSII